MNIKDFISKVGQNFTSKEVAELLDISPLQTTKIVDKWIKAGWIQRQSRGVYSVIPISQHHQSIDNPWALLPRIVGDSDYYICGWSACEYFGLTEQIFNDISVAIHPFRERKSISFSYGKFIFFTVPQNAHFGMKSVWIGDEKIPVSDIHKTILDIVFNPSWGGGVIHVLDCLKNYLKHEDADLERLLAYGDLLGVGTFFKRLGFYLESILGRDHEIIKKCRKRITRGYSYLDPQVKGTKHIAAWQLIVPEGLNLGETE